MRMHVFHTLIYILFMLICSQILVNFLILNDVTWPARDVCNILSCLSIHKLNYLVLSSNCFFTCEAPHHPAISQVKVNKVRISESITIDSLQAILQAVDVDVLQFMNNSQVLNMGNVTLSPPQVRYYITVSFSYQYM